MSLAVILQVSFLPAVRVFGVVPNIALVLMVLISMIVVTSEALIVAALSGLVLDLASGSNFGLWTGVMVLVALAVGMMQRAGLELDRIVVALVLVCCRNSGDCIGNMDCNIPQCCALAGRRSDRSVGD